MHVIVVGGGIVGLAAAHSLADRGADVTLCEKGSLGGESTQRAVGGIRTQFSTPVNVDLSLASLDVWESFEEDFGVDVAFRRAGYLFLARTADTADAFREQAAMQNARGGDTAVLDPAEATEHCPGLRPGAFVAATYSPLDGFADPNLAAQGYAQALDGVGVTVRSHALVTDVRTDDGAVVGVETRDDRIDADFVVNAAGPWGGRVAAMAGVDLPVEPKRRQIAVCDPEVPVPEDVPLTIDLDGDVHFRPERDGAALVGGNRPGPDPAVDPDGYRTDVDLDWAVETVERAGEWTAYFGPETRLARGWAGLYAVTPDHHPVVEETRPGFVNAVGFSGHGFQHAPAVGRVVAELVLDGEASLVDVDPLRSARFAEGDLRDERNVA